MGNFLTRFEDEIVLESSLHVPTYAAAQCEAQYGFTRLPSAPSLTAVDSSAIEKGLMGLLAPGENSPKESKRSLAVCLATPYETDTEETVRSRSAAITNVNR